MTMLVVFLITLYFLIKLLSLLFTALMDMTGAPCKTIRFDDADVKAGIDNGQVWQDLLSYDQQNYIMAASSRSNGKR